MARRSLTDIMADVPDFDREKLDATTEADIRGYKLREGYGPGDAPAGPVLSVPVAADLRARMGLTQGAFARLLRIPVSTLRNWEQGRKVPDPAARTLLALVAADTAHALAILSGETPRGQEGTRAGPKRVFARAAKP